MKICFIIATLNAGGAERVLVTLANAFSSEYEVEIIKFYPQDSFYALNENIKITTLKNFKFNNIYNKIASRFKKMFAIRKALKESKADIFISFLDTTNIPCIIAKFNLKTPLIICEHSSKGYLKSKFWRCARYIFYPYANALTVLSTGDKKYYEKFVKNVHVMLNPCHFEITNNLNKEDLVLFIGRLDINKNAAMFIKMIKELDENLQKNTKFIIIGDGDERKNLQNLATFLNVRVEFLGQISNVKHYYERAKVLCLCSFIEGLPTVLIESLYFEVCRISNRYEGGCEDLINDKVDGFLVDNEKAMADALSVILKDENLRKQIITNAKKRCVDFELSNIKNKWLKLIQGVINNA
ncbi:MULTISPECIES: glycosyltransferase [unclassified Campylobacter]|uniref:glycosyltransferase n=1 Tax=unclassified Campylobacter TaxID=2593542 RepID=UPI0012381AE5|nr:MULTISPECIES: glycosyltransferase [unclassified Campylobacter]KAA6225467.1 glycosyltransferase family 4 protein [Campylobacter sp. LR196d]KAA6227405.1 glycosyltransferase family 4 protein [Campylobacter sp. LR185c]KAA6229738.1 glycosyltransferase family 4 protein [Campylobacter sp. LR286c]KAA6234263.1 glycosyltransferase family 4 protein [Campylobacter sp. LR291e]KAA6234481.1 glycosyltransferase family 4 protein [Campylobacter sp. LR264d]